MVKERRMTTRLMLLFVCFLCVLAVVGIQDLPGQRLWAGCGILTRSSASVGCPVY